MNNQTNIYVEISEERIRQNFKWGGPDCDDARKTQEDWCEDIIAYATWAKQMARCCSPERYRRRMMQIATLAVAACESFDRKLGEQK